MLQVDSRAAAVSNSSESPKRSHGGSDEGKGAGRGEVLGSPAHHLWLRQMLGSILGAPVF